MCCGDRLRRIDLFGLPVNLTYEGDFTFNTACGGLASLIVIMILLAQISLEVLDLVINHKMSYQTTYDYFDYGETNTQEWILNTKQETLAGALKVSIPFRA